MGLGSSIPMGLGSSISTGVGPCIPILQHWLTLFTVLPHPEQYRPSKHLISPTYVNQERLYACHNNVLASLTVTVANTATENVETASPGTCWSVAMCLNTCTHHYSVFRKSTVVHIPWHICIRAIDNLFGSMARALLYKVQYWGTGSCLPDRLATSWLYTYKCVYPAKSQIYMLAESYFRRSSVRDHFELRRNQQGRSNRHNRYTGTICPAMLHCDMLVENKTKRGVRACKWDIVGIWKISSTGWICGWAIGVSNCRNSTTKVPTAIDMVPFIMISQRFHLCLLPVWIREFSFTSKVDLFLWETVCLRSPYILVLCSCLATRGTAQQCWQL